MRLDAQDIGEVGAIIWTEDQINEAFDKIDEYAFRLKQKRMAVTRQRVRELLQVADNAVASLKAKLDQDIEDFSDEFVPISEATEQIDTLLGNAFDRPPRWSDLRRHIGFWQLCDVSDIVNHDWPSIYPVLRTGLYANDEPIETEVDDLGTAVLSEQNTPITTQLSWRNLTPDDFERLVFNLITDAGNYKDPQWLTKTNAPDRGRDLSAIRVHDDALTGSLRQRVIIQCKHWQSKSVSIEDLSSIEAQMILWQPPTVDCVVVATSGRFTTDAIDYAEKNNQGGKLPKIEMWPESHLEMLLAMRPALIAEFRLKG